MTAPTGYTEADVRRIWRDAHEAVQADLPVRIRRLMRAKRRRAGVSISEIVRQALEEWVK